MINAQLPWRSWGRGKNISFKSSWGILSCRKWPEMPRPQQNPMIWAIYCLGNLAVVWGHATITNHREEGWRPLPPGHLPLNCPPTQPAQEPLVSFFEISFWPQATLIPTLTYKPRHRLERAQRLCIPAKVSISGISCQTHPNLHSLHSLPSRTASSQHPRALSHPQVWAWCPGPCACHASIVIFTTLHLPPRPLSGLLGGHYGSKTQLDGRDSRILLYFCDQRVAEGSSSMATCYLCPVWWPLLFGFPYIVSLFKQHVPMANYTGSTREWAGTKSPDPSPFFPVSEATPLSSVYVLPDSIHK